MKQANIQITFEEEKLRALRRYIAKRDSTLEAELQKLRAGFVLQIDFRAVLRDVKARRAHTCASDFFCGLRTGLSCVQSLMYSCTAAGTTFS